MFVFDLIIKQLFLLAFILVQWCGVSHKLDVVVDFLIPVFLSLNAVLKLKLNAEVHVDMRVGTLDLHGVIGHVELYVRDGGGVALPAQDVSLNRLLFALLHYAQLLRLLQLELLLFNEVL